MVWNPHALILSPGNGKKCEILRNCSVYELHRENKVINYSCHGDGSTLYECKCDYIELHDMIVCVVVPYSCFFNAGIYICKKQQL